MSGKAIDVMTHKPTGPQNAVVSSAKKLGILIESSFVPIAGIAGTVVR